MVLNSIQRELAKRDLALLKSYPNPTTLNKERIEELTTDIANFDAAVNKNKLIGDMA